MRTQRAPGRLAVGVALLALPVEFHLLAGPAQPPQSFVPGPQVRAAGGTSDGCLYGLTPSSAQLSAAVSSGMFAVGASSGSCAWTAQSGAGWLTITAGASGTGSGSVAYSAAANPAAYSRNGAILVGGQTFTVIQAGSAPCTYTVSPMQQTAAAGAGAFSATVYTQAGCSWTASPDVSWIATTQSGGTGQGALSFSVAANTGERRTGTLTVAGQKITVVQLPPATAFVCVASAGTPPAVNSQGHAELLGDLLLTCTGQVPSTGLTGDITLTLNTNVSSRAAGSDLEATEALLLIDEPASPALGNDAFLGRLEGYNVIRWAGVPLVSGSFNGTKTLRLTNVRVDASFLGVPANMQPIPILGTVALSSSVAVPISSPTQVLGLSQTGLQFRRETGVAGPNPNQRLVPVNFQELYPGAFRAPGGASGYANADALGPVVGRPTQDTRFRLRLSNVPSAAQVYAPVNSANGNARLVSADSSGAGGSPVQGSSRVGGTYSQIPIDAKGSGFATWEVTAGNPASLQTYTFQVLVENATTDQLSQLVVSGSLAPVNDTVSSSSTVPVPRFRDTDVPVRLVNLVARSTVQPRRISAAGYPVIASTSGQREASVSVGSNVTYVHEVANDTDIAAPNVVLRDSLAHGLQLVSCTRDGAACAGSGNYISESVGSLAPGARTTLTVVARVTDALQNGAIVENVISATSDLPGDIGASSASSTFDVTGGCTFAASGPQEVFPAAGGRGKITVAAASNCKWKALQPVVDWLTVDSTDDQTGAGEIAFAVAENTGADERTGFIFGPMYPFPVVQAGAASSAPPAGTGASPLAGAGDSTAILVALRKFQRPVW